MGGLNNSAYVSDPNQWVDPMGLMGDKNNKGLFWLSDSAQKENEKAIAKIEQTKPNSSKSNLEWMHSDNGYPKQSKIPFEHTYEGAWDRKMQQDKNEVAALKVKNNASNCCGLASDKVQLPKTYRVGVLAITAGGDSTPVKGKGASSAVYFAKEKDGLYMGTSGTQSDTIGFGGSAGLGIDWYFTDLDGFKGRALTSETCFIAVCGRIHQNPVTKERIGYGISPLTEYGGSFTHSDGDTQLYHEPINLIEMGK